eukprot:1678673-Alexandrium_andersonii.AAC.1
MDRSAVKHARTHARTPCFALRGADATPRNGAAGTPGTPHSGQAHHAPTVHGPGRNKGNLTR